MSLKYLKLEFDECDIIVTNIHLCHRNSKQKNKQIKKYVSRIKCHDKMSVMT